MINILCFISFKQTNPLGPATAQAAGGRPQLPPCGACLRPPPAVRLRFAASSVLPVLRPAQLCPVAQRLRRPPCVPCRPTSLHSSSDFVRVQILPALPAREGSRLPSAALLSLLHSQLLGGETCTFQGSAQMILP